MEDILGISLPVLRKLDSGVQNAYELNHVDILGANEEVGVLVAISCCMLGTCFPTIEQRSKPC